MFKIISFSFLVVIPAIIFAQNSSSLVKRDTTESESTDKTRWQMLGYDGKAAVGSVLNAFSQPVRWQGKDWLTFGGVAAGTAILYAFDDNTQRFFNDQEDDIPQVVKEFGFRIGKPLINYGLTTGIYVTGLITKNEKIRRTGVLLIASATAGGLIQSVVKTVAGRARPGTGLGKDQFRFYDERAGFHSLPSGHTVLAVTTAHALAKQFKNPFTKTGIYLIGAISPISRIWSGAHWVTDVFLGAAMSVAIVEGVDHYLNRKEFYSNYKKTAAIRWNLSVGAGSLGLRGTF
ncbi:phosphatase PAP2 family protein [Aquimarina sp. ERC-38]|uniref:phosphatase PAP2 family protein n=1 Tax=Aquimarina sp. ERC-38 TaxID=2949996 RepID=UPI0022481099|nr:phosphatase PAP2 family protein [Aquimarina sp. ERC-38]UZO81240.1 phosphatase PAP2 family protein [Aquimarina sp. ERC-38]